MQRHSALKIFLVALTTATLLCAAPAAAEESLEEVLAQYYEAMGGLDAWKKVKTLKQTGTMSMMGMEAPFTMHAAEPNKMHVQFEIQGMTGIQAFDGKTGWMVMPFMTGSDKPEVMPEAETKDLAATSGIAGPLFDYKEKGHTARLVGKEDVEGTETYNIELTLESGKVMHWYLDSEYYVPIQQKMTINMQGQEMESTTLLSDYKEVGGVMLPHTMEQKIPMGSQVLTSETVEVNVELADDFFTMPATEEADSE